MHSQHFISPKVEFLNSSTSTLDESGRGSPWNVWFSIISSNIWFS